MQNILGFFVTNGFALTTAVLFFCAALIFVVVILAQNWFSRLIFPAFGYSKMSDLLPFSGIMNDNMTIAVRDGALVRVYKISGVQTSMQDAETKQKFLDLRTQLFDSVRDPGVIFRFFTVRDAADFNNKYEFDQPTLQMIYNKWESQGLKIFNNSYYVAISVAGAFAADKMEKYANILESVLAPYGVSPCLHNSANNNAADFFARLLSPVSKPDIRAADANMNTLITADSADFMKNGIIKFSSGADDRHAAALSFKTSPDFMDEDFFDAVGTLQCEMISMNAFQVLGSAAVDRVIRQKMATADSSKENEEIIADQISESKYAMDENISGAQSMVNFYPLFIVFERDTDALEKQIQEFKKICAGFGVSPVVENFAAKVSYFSMLPGFDTFPRSFKMLSRTATTAIPMSRVPAGIPNSDWGPGPIVVFPTAQGTPYQFQFHVSESQGATAHTLTIGPTGGGKTTLFSFLIAQSLRHPKLKAFFFDRNRGAEIFTLATGGKYLTFYGKSKDSDKIAAGFETQLNPFKMTDTPENRAFMRRWLTMISGQNDPASLDEVARAVSIAFDYLDEKDRKLDNLWTSCFSPDGNMRAALKKWVDPLQYGTVFNENKDTLDLFSRLTTFDFTDILNDETLAPAVVSYIIHRINQITVSGGNPSLIMIDETAPMLANEMFRENFITGLREGRKNRQAYMAAFQQADVIDKLGIGDAVRGQAQTVMFFRNPGASAGDYAKWNLNPLEMAFIQGKAYPNLKRAVLLSRPVNNESVVLNTELGGLGSILRLFESGRSSVLLAEELYKKFGSEFVEEYLKRQNV